MAHIAGSGDSGKTKRTASPSARVRMWEQPPFKSGASMHSVGIYIPCEYKQHILCE